MKPLLKAIIYSILVLLLVACGRGGVKQERGSVDENKTIMVYSAASLTDVLSELIDSFEIRYHVEVRTNMASSGTLARQINQGGAPDIFLSANKKWADYIDSLGLMIPGTKSGIAKNELVLIAPLNSKVEVPEIDSSLDMLALLGSDRLSMGDPSHVPAGKYAMQSLLYFGWQEIVKGKTIPAKDVRSALMVVEMQEAPIGIVYKTDAQKSGKVRILNTFPENSHQPIVYYGGVCSKNPNAVKFFTFIHAEETRGIWEKHGFF